MSSRRIILVVAIVLMTVAGLAVATQGGNPVAATPPVTNDVPPGVKPEMWQRLSPRLGIAVQVERGEKGTKQFHGTLLFRDGDKWQPIILKEPSGVVPAR